MLFIGFKSVSMAKRKSVDPLAQVCVINLFWSSCNNYLIWFPVENSWKILNICRLNPWCCFHIRSPRGSYLCSFGEFVCLLFSLVQNEKPVFIMLAEFRAHNLSVLLICLQVQSRCLVLFLYRYRFLSIEWFIPIDILINCLSINFTPF